MTAPLVSILITAWNRQNSLPQTVESALKSTYQNFEIIICDDCSADSTYEIAKKYAETDIRIKTYRNSENLGDYKNRNKAASYASGKYLKYLDSDDRIYPHSLEVMVNYMEQYPQAAFAFTASHIHLTRTGLLYPLLFEPSESFREHFLNGGFFYSGPTSLIIRKNIFDQFHGFSGKRFLSDLELMMGIALQCQVLMLPPGLVWLGTNDDREELIEFSTPAILGDRYRLVTSFLYKSPLTAKEKRKALLSLDKILARHILKNFFLKLKPAKALQIKKNAGLSYPGLLRAFHITRFF